MISNRDNLTLSSVVNGLIFALYVILHAAAFAEQTVYFYAWGGSPQVNQYLQWAKQELATEKGIHLQHVKLADTSDAVSRILAEKAAGNLQSGSVDLLWVNGENFASMLKHNLLAEPWVDQLKNFSLTRPEKNPAVLKDFGIATEKREAPWGKAALVFYYHSGRVNQPPKQLSQLIPWLKKYPARFTYPRPPDFYATSFLKYAISVLNEHQADSIKQQLYQPVTEKSFNILAAPLWHFLDELHPLLWRQGRYFPSSGAQMQRLVDDQAIYLSYTFTAAEVPAAVSQYNLPPQIRTYAMQDGSLSNIHFVAIPFNAKHKTAAKQVADFLLSPKAQAKKQQIEVWGDQTVLDMSALNNSQRAMFNTLQRHPSALPANTEFKLLSELHPSWVDKLNSAWLQRYGVF
ncbi:ABC transporter substrate-binding protein [Gayadomonas joobiniege]|uniref:ABC transporter substrate-binding protein n=1 Tax=Gayadomonas joobiniege TaxID=1234606 RepID=UPI00036731EC|nr:ABC transporter substrate-binding protein [Gayadomonas joobiniege]